MRKGGRGGGSYGWRDLDGYWVCFVAVQGVTIDNLGVGGLSVIVG